MHAAELIAAVSTVEKDHELVLDRVQGLKEAVALLVDPSGIDYRPILTRLQQLTEFFGTQFTAHLEEEEKDLFPLLERWSAGGQDLVARLRREHSEIRRKHAELSNCLELALELEDGVPRMVLRDLLIYGWELWEILDRHARVETREVRNCVLRAVADPTRPLAV